MGFRKIYSSLHVFILSSLLLSSCVDEYKFSNSNELGGLKKFTITEPPNGVVAPICDPFSSVGISSKEYGLKGSLYNWPSSRSDKGDYPQSLSDILSGGKKVEGDLFLSSVNVPERMFDKGFSNVNGKIISNKNGDPLIEWFGLELESKLVLKKGELAGNYELALISDDGSSLEIDGVKWIDNNVGGPSKLVCAQNILSIKEGESHSLKIGYYQGPRFHISFTLLWRRIPDGGSRSPSSIGCGVGLSNYYWDQSTSAVKAPLQNLFNKGWKVLDPENFMLKDGVTNPCN